MMPASDEKAAVTSAKADEQLPRPLAPAAERALAEAEARRKARASAEGSAVGQPAEKGGRGGPDPVRYGDWENGGIASDF